MGYDIEKEKREAIEAGRRALNSLQAVSYTHLDVYKRQKEDLVPIIGDENMIQEMPEEFNKVLEVQKS